jgi:hypothetical protein
MFFLTPDGYDREDDLEFWIQKCLDFNPEAKARKKKAKKNKDLIETTIYNTVMYYN